MQNEYLDELLVKYGHLVWNKWNAPAESTTYIGRGSLYGNPIPLTNPKDPQERIEVILEFQRYLTRRLQDDAIFAGAVMSLKGRDLACYCSNGKSSLDDGARILPWIDSLACSRFIASERFTVRRRVYLRK